MTDILVFGTRLAPSPVMYRTRTYGEERLFPKSTSMGALVFAILLILTGCVPNQNTQNGAPGNSVATNTAPANTNQGNAQSDTAASRVPITLPVVDALLADEAFISEVRRVVQPTDEQLDKLKNMARDAVLKLNEDGIDESRSTRASRAEADKQIKQILGNEGGDKFIALARQYWAGGDIAPSLKPNEVPTDTRIVINAPAYRMDLFQNGKLIRSYKVGIGYPEFPLPVGVRSAKTIIFNPPWTPPDEPWVKGEFQPGKTVKPGSKKNPLGILKIPIGLPSLIHGGKAPSRLGTFASHGCVGLTNDLVTEFALELATLSGTQLTPEQIAEYGQNRTETKEVDLSKPVTVELRYETIVAEDGKLHIYRDVYEHGTNTEDNLSRILESFGVSMNDLSPEEQTTVRDALRNMAVDARGKPVDEDEKNQKDKPSTSSRVTRNVKGQKEIVVDVAALKGKGYPAPVNINS